MKEAKDALVTARGTLSAALLMVPIDGIAAELGALIGSARVAREDAIDLRVRRDAAEKRRADAEANVTAEALAVYQGGHPLHLQAAAGTLRLDGLGLLFETGVAGTWFRIHYASLADVLEPRPGTFSAEMQARAEKTRKAAAAGRTLAGVAGNFVGGQRGRAISAVAGGVASGAQQQSALGAVPRNRLLAILIEGSVRHKVAFDVMAATRPEIEALAHAFWMRAASVRRHFGVSVRPTPRAAVMPPSPASLASPPSSTVVVGCPGCRAKLRARSPGVIQCPNCRAKVRVAEAMFRPEGRG